MAKKAELLDRAKELGLEVSEKNTVAEIEAAINGSDVQEITEEAPVAKAGKRSAKALKEAEEKAEKEERKASGDTEDKPEKPKQKQNPPRTHLERKGKKYRELAKQIDSEKLYSLKEAVELAVKTSPATFDASVELHVNLGVDPKHADQNIRDIVSLPAGTGKTVRIAVFADDEGAAAAKKAGADIAGEEAVTKELEKGNLNFDVLIATPQMMAKLSKFARVLGPKGLMPNPKSGTVTNDVAKGVEEAKAGRVEYRVDSSGIVHLAFGKVSFGTDKLMQNAEAVTKSIRGNKPSSLKGNYVQAVYVTTAMGPSVKVSPNEI